MEFHYNTINNTFFFVKFSHIRATIKPNSPYSKLNDKQLSETLSSSNRIGGRDPHSAATNLWHHYYKMKPLWQINTFISPLNEMKFPTEHEHSVWSSVCHQLEQSNVTTGRKHGSFLNTRSCTKVTTLPNVWNKYRPDLSQDKQFYCHDIFNLHLLLTVEGRYLYIYENQGVSVMSKN